MCGNWHTVNTFCHDMISLSGPGEGLETFKPLIKCSPSTICISLSGPGEGLETSYIWPSVQSLEPSTVGMVRLSNHCHLYSSFHARNGLKVQHRSRTRIPQNVLKPHKDTSQAGTWSRKRPIQATHAHNCHLTLKDIQKLCI
jgi:hypothetical protein